MKHLKYPSSLIDVFLLERISKIFSLNCIRTFNVRVQYIKHFHRQLLKMLSVRCHAVRECMHSPANKKSANKQTWLGIFITQSVFIDHQNANQDQQ